MSGSRTNDLDQGDPGERWDPELDGAAAGPNPIVDRRSLTFRSSSASHVRLEGKDAPPLPEGIASVVHLAESINGRQSARIRVTSHDGRVVDYSSLDDAPPEVRAFLSALPMPGGASGHELLAAALEQIGANRSGDGGFALKVGPGQLPPDLRAMLGSGATHDTHGTPGRIGFSINGTPAGSGFVLKLIAAALILIAGLLLYLALR